METRAGQLGHMTARMVCGFICVLLMSRFMFYCGFTCVLFMMSFRCVYDSLVFAFMLRLRCFMLVLYVFGLCKALSLRSGSYRRSPLGLPKTGFNFSCGACKELQAINTKQKTFAAQHAIRMGSCASWNRIYSSNGYDLGIFSD